MEVKTLEESSTYNIYCLHELKASTLIDSLLILDIIFYISSLTINILISLTEALGTIPDHTYVYQITFYFLFTLNILGFGLATNCKGAWKRWLQKQKTRKFRVYFYYRAFWSIICVLICLFVLIFGFFDLRASHGKNDAGEIKFVKITMVFCFVYFGYSGTILINNSDFLSAWFSLIEKDIEFYYD